MLILSTALNIFWLVEQPEGSKDVLMRHPRLDFFTNCISWVAWLHKDLVVGMLQYPCQAIYFFKTYSIYIYPSVLEGMEAFFLDDALRSINSKKNGGVEQLPIRGPCPCLNLSFWLHVLHRFF